MKLLLVLTLENYVLVQFFLSAVHAAEVKVNLTTAPDLPKAVLKFNYCKVTCNGKKHTLCEYKEGGPSDCATFNRGLSDTMRDTLVDVHNSLRQQVAAGMAQGGWPPAGNMMELEWDDEAEWIAQRWADQCEMGGQDECRTLSDKTVGGQNMVSVPTNDEVDLYTFAKKRVIEWYNTGQHFKRDSIAKYKPDPASTAFSQIIWAETTKLGCGFSHGTLEENGSVWRLVCNYYPGPVEGKPVYLEGKPCSRCPAVKCSQIDPGLCAHPEDHVYNRKDVSAAPPGPTCSAFSRVVLAVSLAYVSIFYT